MRLVIAAAAFAVAVSALELWEVNMPVFIEMMKEADELSSAIYKKEVVVPNSAQPDGLLYQIKAKMAEYFTEKRMGLQSDSPFTIATAVKLINSTMRGLETLKRQKKSE